MSSLLSNEESTALLLSLQVALTAWLICLVPGIAIAWILARKSFPGKTLLDAIVHLPLILPPVAVGYLLLLLVGRYGAFGPILSHLHIQIAFTWKAAVVASAVMAFPLMVRSVRIAFELVDTGLEAAAQTLGASPLRVFLTITLPLASAGIIAGSVLCFARSLGEFGATLTVAGNILGQTRTLPVAIYTYTQTPGGDRMAMRLMILSIALSLASLVISEWISRRALQRRASR